MSQGEKMPSPDYLKNFRELRAGARAAKKVELRHKSQETDLYASRGEPWDSFAKNAEKYLKVFEDFFPGITDSIEKKFSTERENNKEAIAVDLAGAADASSIGATRTICMILQDLDLEAKKGQEILAGNLLSKRGLELLLDVLKKTVPPTAVFFRPIAATYDYKLNKYAYLKISRVLSEMYGLLRPGGEMLIDLRWIPVETDNLDPKLRDLFQGERAQVTQGIRLVEGKSELRNIYRIVKPDQA